MYPYWLGFILDPLCFHSFFYDETITALVETVTEYCSDMDLVSRALKILILLSQKRMIMIHDSHTEDLRGRLKRAGVMRMIDCVYATYSPQHTVELSLSDLERSTSAVAPSAPESPEMALLMLAREVETNLGMRSETRFGVSPVDAVEESEDDNAERLMMETLTHKLIHSERNIQLQLLDGFMELALSDCIAVSSH